MSDRNLSDGRWVNLGVRTDAEKVARDAYARVRKLDWAGPGWYLVLHYSQPCPRGCCMDAVTEFVSAKDVVAEVRAAMIELAGLLHTAKSKESQ